MRHKLITLAAVLLMSNSVLADNRLPASISPTQPKQIYATDFCEFNCNRDQSIPEDLVQVYDYMKTQNTQTFDYGKMVPKTLQSGQDPILAMNQIADNSLQYWWNSSGAKETPLGHGVSTVENSMKQEVDLGTTKSKVKQKINIAYDAFQNQAKLKYEGYTEAEMFYQARDSSMGLQMINKIGSHKDLIIGETIHANSDQTGQVTFKWDW